MANMQTYQEKQKPTNFTVIYKKILEYVHIKNIKWKKICIWHVPTVISNIR